MALNRTPSATLGAPMRRWFPLVAFGGFCGLLALGVATAKPGAKGRDVVVAGVGAGAPRPLWSVLPIGVGSPQAPNAALVPAALPVPSPVLVGAVAPSTTPWQAAPPSFSWQAQLVAATQVVPVIAAGQPPPHGERGPCEGCHTYLGQPGAAPVFPSVRADRARARAFVDRSASAGWAVPVAGAQPVFGGIDASPPRASGSTNLPLQEAHWQGVEVIPCSPALAKALGISPTAKGVIADDVTLAADAAGMMGGDVVLAVGQVPTPNLESFIQATDRVRERSRAEVLVQRRGQDEPVLLVVTVEGRLGTAQGEAAPMIPGGSVPPHRYQGPCTNCHRIGTTGQLPIDQGDLLTKRAPVIRAGWPPPHQERGACASCHEILP